jgi:hypothetical protein
MWPSVGVRSASAKRGTGIPLAFYQSQPVVQMSFNTIPLTFTLDTGAVHTTLNPPFASLFPEMIARGEAKEHTLTGMGGSTTQKSVELKMITFSLDGAAATLSPATVLLKSMTGNSKWAAGNLGSDLIQQTAPFTVDFRTMTFTVER